MIANYFYPAMKENKNPHAGESACTALQCSTKPTQRALVGVDDSDIRQLNSGVLKRSGCHVDAAEDGDAEKKMLHAASHAPESYDLLIADRDLPGLSNLCPVKKPRAARMALPVNTAIGTLA